MVQYFRLCLHLLGWLSCHFVLCMPKFLLGTLCNEDINMWIFFKQLHTRKWEFSSLRGLIIMLPSFRIPPLTLIASYFMLKWKSYQCMTAAATDSHGGIALGHITCSLLYTELSFFSVWHISWIYDTTHRWAVIPKDVIIRMDSWWQRSTLDFIHECQDPTNH